MPFIRMQDPLKQGLKLKFDTHQTQFAKIRMQDPLKQGLKLYTTSLSPYSPKYSNARSIKTRIETLHI
ncbi:conserved hypothetical protein [Methanosarcina thermophila]|uniref:Uncharacterized protein n=1 Tax=Methanosarcina thermophila TaxID=2210 RepID=A0A3G9CS34_METTE|nr:conserved hypothetical protein [Methanosarcina thermophila]